MQYSATGSLGFFADFQPTIATHQYTLATTLGLWLQQAEKLYGPRDRSWTILGVEVHQDVPGRRNRPFVWPIGNKQIVVVLTQAAAQNTAEAQFQLAQEIVHLLSPNEKGGDALLIEEGLATRFARVLGCHASEPAYLEAERLFASDILNKYPDAIRRLRKKRKSIHKFDPAFLTKHLPFLKKDVAQKLCEIF
jgi:hypothetical protein